VVTCRITSSASSIQAPSSGQEPILAALRKAVRGLQGVCSALISPSTPAATTTCRTEGAPRCLRARLRLRRRIYRPASFSARPADAGAAGGRPGSRFLRPRLSGTPGFLRQTVRPAPQAGRDMLLASRLRVYRPREGAMPGRARGSQSSLVAVVPQRGGPGEQVQVAPAAWAMDGRLAARYLYGKAPSWLCGHGRCPTDGVIRPSFSPKVTAEGALFCSRS